MSLVKKITSLLLFTIFAFGASEWGALVTNLYKEPWYSTIVKPSFNPPEWVFAPVWTSLYIMMAIAIWKIWISSFDLKILKLYFIHLFFNGTWSIIFFGFHMIGLALINLFIIIIFIVLIMKKYFKLNKLSFYLMVPYFFWSFYALILNTSIFFYN